MCKYTCMDLLVYHGIFVDLTEISWRTPRTWCLVQRGFAMDQAAFGKTPNSTNLPSGKRLQLWKTPCLIGKSTIDDHFLCRKLWMFTGYWDNHPFIWHRSLRVSQCLTGVAALLASHCVQLALGNVQGNVPFGLGGLKEQTYNCDRTIYR